MPYHGLVVMSWPGRKRYVCVVIDVDVVTLVLSFDSLRELRRPAAKGLQVSQRSEKCEQGALTVAVAAMLGSGCSDPLVKEAEACLGKQKELSMFLGR